MFAITGITGQVGGQLAGVLLGQGLKVRAVLRNEGKAVTWAAQGCEIAIAAMDDAAALRAAFTGVEAVFVLLPSNFDPVPGFGEVARLRDALVEALRAAMPPRVVFLSTIGAQAREENLLTQLQIVERALAELPMPLAFLRAAWFMENTAMDIESARQSGVVQSFLQPADKPVPMVATADIAAVAAELLQERWTGLRVVELEGSARITPHELAATLGRVLQREVKAEAVPRGSWEDLFRAQGMANPGPRMRMLDGFNEGWIEFESGPGGSRKGTTSLETVLRGLVAG
ncbi:NmrA family transcriptional regulator [Rhodoferax koreense]|uniref:NmrA family transcriptional regulator n=1 Tax=Rhodoferax koreensis TaxID=1842727 RepID=A0A1P8K3Z3_9BURK|nr:NmrA family NAD(P)-binding protein [Rhodoferax koreense]APW40719.1 NmrA family transcriptional regulator [Rhodoferax koreense]